MTNVLVNTTRLQYTSSPFAQTSLIYLQGTGSLVALRPHTSARENLGGYLLLVVENGVETVIVDGKECKMMAGNVAIIACS